MIHEINAFLTRTGMAWTKFGRLFTNDPRFVQDLRNGRTPRPQTVARIRKSMRDYLESLE